MGLLDGLLELIGLNGLLVVLFVLILTLALILIWRFQREHLLSHSVERLKHRVGITTKVNFSSQHSEVDADCRFCKLGRALLPLLGKDADRLRLLLAQAGYRKMRHLWFFVFVKYTLFISMTIGAVISWALLQYSVIVLILVPIVFLLLPDYVLKSMANSRQQKIIQHLPDYLDMCNITMNAGLGYLVALKRVSKELKSIHPEVCTEFEFLLEQIEIGVPRVVALKEFAERNNSADITSLVEMLVQNEKIGAPIGQSIYEFTRRMYQRREEMMEEKAAKTSAKMALVILPFMLLPYIILLVGENMVNLARGF